MKNLSKTRWIGRAESFKAVWASFDVIVDTLKVIRNHEKTDRDTRKTASNLLDKVQSFEFYLSILFMKNILYKVNILVLEVQEVTQDILARLDPMKQTIEAMLNMRNDEVAVEGVIELASNKCKYYGEDAEYEFRKKHRLRLPQARFDESRECSNSPYFSQFYRQEMYKVLDRLIADLVEAKDYLLNITLPIMTLLPLNITNASMEAVLSLCDKFPKDLKDNEAVMAEIELASGSICRSEVQNLRDAAKWFVGKSHIYPNLSKAYRIALTVPISVASNERSFSKLKLSKGYLRSTMKEDRLDYLMVAACSNDILDRLDLDEVAESWSFLKTRRIKI